MRNDWAANEGAFSSKLCFVLSSCPMKGEAWLWQWFAISNHCTNKNQPSDNCSLMLWWSNHKLSVQQSFITSRFHLVSEYIGLLLPCYARWHDVDQLNTPVTYHRIYSQEYNKRLLFDRPWYNTDVSVHVLSVSWRWSFRRNRKVGLLIIHEKCDNTLIANTFFLDAISSLGKALSFVSVLFHRKWCFLKPMPVWN